MIAILPKNKLLASLPIGVFMRLQKDLELVSLLQGDLLYNSGENLRFACFPVTSIISLRHAMESGTSIEIAAIGNEGAAGFPLFMGTDSTPSSAVVQVGGLAYKLARATLLKELDANGELKECLLRYTYGLMMEIGQTAVCNRHHSIEQQLCRWLLNTLDRLPTAELTMTQELISNTLGVRREAITEAAGNLQASGCIRYRRGHITVLNRKGLEKRSCECYTPQKNTVRQ